MDEHKLTRYTDVQQSLINKYWDTVRWTRKHGKISEKIRQAEQEYWERFNPEIVAAALETHISKYPKLRENYTRGIMRNMTEQAAADVFNPAQGANNGQVSQWTGRTRLPNFDQREVDFDEIERLERERIARVLADTKT